MDTLVTDSNRSIATLAITTLLKTGSESSVDRLMKQISSFLGEISDEFKQVVVEALQVCFACFAHEVLSVFRGCASSSLRSRGC